jgi:hypothetical protein
MIPSAKRSIDALYHPFARTNFVNMAILVPSTLYRPDPATLSGFFHFGLYFPRLTFAGRGVLMRAPPMLGRPLP